MNSLRHFPLGEAFNKSACCHQHLPTMADVRGYEEQDPRVVKA